MLEICRGKKATTTKGLLRNKFLNSKMYCMGVFPAAGTGELVRVEERLNVTKIQR